MSTKSKRRAARRHPEETQETISEDVIAATIVEGLLNAVTFGAIEDSPSSTPERNRDET
ncbi:MAG: hypothetical protein JST00_18295 [Deltaproteobacteria bacterium]|nr:hypothetical protein [Deltaproteobacteria bacterium]